MIWAVYKDGLFYPSEPVPSDWKNGQRVSVLPEGAEPSDDPAEIDRWDALVKRLGPMHYEPGERERVRAIMAEADAQSKDQVRKSMDNGH